MSLLTRLKSWEDLEKHRETLAGTHLRELFAGDPQRVSALSMILSIALRFSQAAADTGNDQAVGRAGARGR